jgi:cytochrome c
MLNRGKVALAALFFASLGSKDAFSQTALKYEGCADVTQANFTKVVVVDKTKDPNMDEIIRFAVSKSGAVYYAERAGGIKVAKDGVVKKIGTIDVYPPTEKLKKPAISGVVNNINNEFGLVGMTLDRDFDNNHFLYVDYQAHTVDETRISRFTVNGDVLDLASEKILVAFPIQKDYCCHTGGDMRMDAKGDLWVSIGNNTMNHSDDTDPVAYVDESIANSVANDQGHSANTNDLRGKILRIHPTADGSYTVPAGNFKDFYASMYTAEEKAKIKPEIYAMGARNPYSIAVDDLNGWVAWGDVGPDTRQLTEEWNLITKPGFMGWPYFAGAEGNPVYKFKLDKDPLAPMNTSKDNTGVQKLPPAQGAIIAYSEACAMTGPIVRWSDAQTSAKKLPGHFDGKWFVTDWLTKIGIKVITLGAGGTSVASNVSFFDGNFTTNPLGLQVAPDGVLYMLEYNSGYRFATGGVTPTMAPNQGPMKISRIEYTGAPCAVTTSLVDLESAKRFAKNSSMVSIGLAGSRTVAVPVGIRSLALYDLRGKMVWSAHSFEKKAGRIAVPGSVGNGVYRVKYEF